MIPGGIMKNVNELHVPIWEIGLNYANQAPRCGAKTRQKTSCQSPAMKNGRCRLHGGKSTGPRTLEGLQRSRKANWKHGNRSAEVIQQRKESMKVKKELNRLVESVGNL